MRSTRGELIQEKLTEVSLKCGCPRQIIADRGSDIQKGIKLYQSLFSSTVSIVTFFWQLLK